MQPGFIEGQLRIFSSKPVELADENRPKFAASNYGEYPLVILSQDGKKEIARVIADANGSYRVALPPGRYLLDVQGRAPHRAGVKPQSFTVVSNQTVRVDANMGPDARVQ